VISRRWNARWSGVALVVLLLLSPCCALAQAAPSPSHAQDAAVDEIRALVASSDYRGALKRIDKLLPPSLRDQPDRYDLLMLKGECQLQLQNRLGAATAFKLAAKAADSPQKLADARANALVVERSTNGKFIPKVGNEREPIDILLIDGRKHAMAALADELWTPVRPQVDAALRASQLPPIEQVFQRVADVYCLELASDGTAERGEKVLRELGGHAYQLMRAEVNKCADRQDYLAQVANSSSAGPAGGNWNSGRMGLTSQQRDEVKAMLPYLAKIRDRAAEYRTIASKLGGEAAKWDALVADAVDAMNDANSLANDR
jgi:hypothetical protein